MSGMLVGRGGVLVFLGLFSFMICYVKQVTNLTPETRSYNIPRIIVPSSLTRACLYNNQCSNAPPSSIYIPSRAGESSSEIIKNIKSRSPMTLRFTPKFVNVKNKLGQTFKIVPFYYIYPKNQLPMKNSNKIESTVNDLLQSKYEILNYDKTTPVYSTVHSKTHLNNDSKILNAIQQSKHDNRKDNNQTTKVNVDRIDEELHEKRLIEYYLESLERFQRLFYEATFDKLLSISPKDRQENGISFIQSGFFLYLALTAISIEVDPATKEELEKCLGFKASTEEKIKILKYFIPWLPRSNGEMKFRQTSRLIVNQEMQISERFINEVTTSARLKLGRLNGTETPDNITNTLNNMVLKDSGGALGDAFEIDDVSGGVCSVLITTMYIRARWRSAPTLLNGTRPFRDTGGVPQRFVRMIRLNDIMQYAALDEWNADALKIKYATPGLTILLLVPRDSSIKRLARFMTTRSPEDVSKRMSTMRVAVTLPIYTLRMTLLLPGKLQKMGISRLVQIKNASQCDEFRLSHAVQRLMFWAEAGRNAFKDDGIEWDESPDLELVVDKPYLFYIQWKNVTLLNGNFVL